MKITKHLEFFLPIRSKGRRFVYEGYSQNSINTEIELSFRFPTCFEYQHYIEEKIFIKVLLLGFGFKYSKYFYND